MARTNKNDQAKHLTKVRNERYGMKARAAICAGCMALALTPAIAVALPAMQASGSGQPQLSQQSEGEMPQMDGLFQGSQQGEMPQAGQEPPALPDGQVPQQGEMPPALPDGEMPAEGQEPPALPDGQTPQQGQEPPALPDGTQPQQGELPPALPDGQAPVEGEEPPALPDGTQPQQGEQGGKFRQFINRVAEFFGVELGSDQLDEMEQLFGGLFGGPGMQGQPSQLPSAAGQGDQQPGELPTVFDRSAEVAA